MKIGFTTLIAALLPLSAHAEVWDFQKCVEYARSHNINLQKSRLNEQTSALNLEESKSQWLPTLDFATTQGLSHSPWSGTQKAGYASSYGLNANWTVWDGNKRDNTIKRDQLQQERSALSTANTIRTLESDLLQVYINILYAQEAVCIAEAGEKLGLSQMQRGEQLMQAGKLSRVDYSQLKSQYEQNHYSTVSAQATYANRILELKNLLELGIDTSLEIASVASLDNGTFSSLPSLDQCYKDALAQDLTLKMYQIDKSSATIDAKIASAGKYPTISLSAGIGTAYNTPTNFAQGLKQNWGENVGLSFSLPIFDANKTKINVAKAKVQTMSADLDIQLRQKEMAQLIEKWYVDTNSARAQYTSALSQLEAAQTNYQLSSERFTLGYINTVELMQAQRDYIDAQYAATQSRYMAFLAEKMIEFYRTSQITLQ